MEQTLFYMKTFILSFLLIMSCFTYAQGPDLIVFNGNIFTSDPHNEFCSAMAIKDGIIIKAGSDTLLNLRDAHTQTLDLQKKFCMPGIIEGHGHMLGLGQSLLALNLIHTHSWQEIISKVTYIVPQLSKGELLIGRGWHQEKWDQLPQNVVAGYPVHDEMSQISPNNPVILYHASGHALFANKKAMELAKIDKNTTQPEGGKIIMNSKGEPTGIFEENAMNLFNDYFHSLETDHSQEIAISSWNKQLDTAQNYCLENGITGFQDAGVSVRSVELYKKYADDGKLKIRMWVMINDELSNIKVIQNRLPIIGYHQDHLSVKALKQYVDGALGSHGAWLLKPYEDKADFVGQNTVSVDVLKEYSSFAFDHHLQMCIHAIGDRANREVLNMYESIFSRDPKLKDLRWRIEHAQHVDEKDIPRFGTLGIIASMQAIHCTSDAPFVAKRLGKDRAQKTSYAWRSILDSGGRLANGTDTPVESVNPFECMYAAVTRKRVDTGFEFYPEQKMTRKEALLSYTIWNAYAAFEDDIKGSLQAGKFADFIILDRDLYHCNETDIPKTKVLKTFIAGKMLYEYN